jgi:NitT/TauT family transport system ATP-binding protein
VNDAVNQTNTETANVIVAADDVGMTFDGAHHALDNVSLSIEGGEFVSIIGPSGCGKSTLLRLIAGLAEPTAGTLTVGGLLPAEARRAWHPMAFVFQDATLLPWRNVIDNIQLPLELERTDLSANRSIVPESLKLIGLSETDAAKYPRMLSGGMRMRVSLARALVTDPALLMLDEPFGALDEMTRQRLNEDLLRIWAEKKWTALFVTHNVAEAVFLSQRILVMGTAPGRIIADVAVPFAYPRSPALRAEADFARLTGEVSARLREASL